MNISQEIILNQCLTLCCKDCKENCPHLALLFYVMPNKKWQELHGHFNSLSDATNFIDGSMLPFSYTSIWHLNKITETMPDEVKEMMAKLLHITEYVRVEPC